jgi:hypothetical protein
VHLPERQPWPGAHTVPHAPQFAGSVVVSAQAPRFSPTLHFVRLPLHLVTQPPDWQLELLRPRIVSKPHALLQVPQSFGLSARSTQVLPHNVRPGAQASVTHALPLHFCPAAHDVPHAAQC